MSSFESFASKVTEQYVQLHKQNVLKKDAIAMTNAFKEKCRISAD